MKVFGWAQIARVGLVQAALGAVVVLTTSTLNRVMVVELALPALLPGLLVALACGLLGGLLDQLQPALQRRQAPGDGAGQVRELADRGDQHQHGGDESHEVAHGHAAAAALPQGHGDHGR